MLRRFVFIGVVLALAAGCGSSPTTPTPPPPPVDPPTQPPPPPAPVYTLGITRILAFGDSMTFGVVPAPGLRFRLDAGAGIPQSYPFKLQALLTARYATQSVQVFNDGIGGKRVDEDRGRLAGDMAIASPQLVLLMEGANDLNTIAISGVPGTNQLVDNVVGQLEDMVRDVVERRGIPVFLATIPPMRDPKGWGKALVPRYNAGIRAMAAKKGATLVDIGAQIPDSMVGSDGLHPTEEGYQRIAEIFLDAIKQKYESAALSTTARVR
jgi:lysophospholipase L1-like esterase